MPMPTASRRRRPAFAAVVGVLALAIVGADDDWDDGAGDYDADAAAYGGGYDDDMGGMGGMDDYGDYGGGGGYGGYGDDEYGGGGGGDPTPAYEVLETLEAAEEFFAAEETEPIVVGFFDEDADADALETFQSVAESHRYDYRFAYATEADVRAAYKYAKSAAVAVFLPKRFVSEKYDKPKARYPSSKLDADAVAKFIAKKSIPLVGQKTWKSNDRYDKARLPILTLYAAIDLEKNGKGFDYFANRLRKVAVEYKDTMLFNIGDKDDFSYSLPDYGFDDKLENKKDVGVGVKDGDKYYKMDAKFNVDNLRAFVEQVLAGELEPKIKEAPEYDDAALDDDDAGGLDDDGGDMYDGTNVVALTTDSFDAELAGKDAFLEFYAPWCGHCQALKPTYKALADELAGTDVLVGAMDATAHDPPAGFDVQGYPTLVFKPHGGDPIPYDGDRDVDAMKAFVKQHTSFDRVKEEL